MTSLAPGNAVAVINCIDGFAQDPILDWIKARFNAPADIVITVWSPDKSLAEGANQRGLETKEHILRCLAGQSTQLIIVVGHDGCTTNSVSQEVHLRQIKQSAEEIGSWKLPTQGASIICWGLWLSADGSAQIVYEG